MTRELSSTLWNAIEILPWKGISAGMDTLSLAIASQTWPFRGKRPASIMYAKGGTVTSINIYCPTGGSDALQEAAGVPIDRISQTSVSTRLAENMYNARKSDNHDTNTANTGMSDYRQAVFFVSTVSNCVPADFHAIWGLMERIFRNLLFQIRKGSSPNDKACFLAYTYIRWWRTN